MKLTDMYGLANYIKMLEKTQLLQTKRQIRNQYLHHVLALKEGRENLKDKIDPIILARLRGELEDYLENLDVMPGFEKAPLEILKPAKARNKKAENLASKANWKSVDSKSQFKDVRSQKEQDSRPEGNKATSIDAASTSKPKKCSVM